MDQETKDIVDLLAGARKRLRRQGGKPTGADLTEAEKQACRDGLRVLRDRGDLDADLIATLLAQEGII